MDPVAIARVHAFARLGLGAGLVLAPGLVGGAWIGADGGRPGSKVLARALGARDVGIALGSLGALSEGAGARRWIRVALLADAADLLATRGARPALPPVGATLVSVMSGGSTVLGAWLQSAVE